MDIRRLDPVNDRHLLETAWSWDDGAPRWRKDCEAVWSKLGERTGERRMHVGIFNEELTAVVHLDLIAKDTYEAHLAVKRGTPLDQLIIAINSIIHQLFSFRMTTAFVWLPRINSAIFRLCEAVGFQHDGVVMFKGRTHKRPIEWWRLVIVNNQQNNSTADGHAVTEPAV